MKPFNREQLRYVQRLESERNRLAERVAIEHRHTDLLERQVHKLLSAFGSSSPPIDISAPIRPREGGVNLDVEDDGAAAYRTHGAPAARATRLLGEWWPRQPIDRPALQPNAGHAVYPLCHRVRKILGVAVLGLEKPELERIVAMIARQQALSQDFIPVFLYDGSALDVFRAHGYVFEWLPPAADRLRYDGGQSWRDYLVARLALIERKWGLTYVVCFGGNNLDGLLAPAAPDDAGDRPLETAA